jgi:hypothetical protein
VAPVIVAAALCPAAPLLVRELTGAALVEPELRAACAEVTRRLVHARPDVIAVVGAGPQTRAWDSGSALDVASFGGPAAAARGPAGAAPGTAGLPAPLGLGARLLDEAGYDGPRLLQAIGQDELPAACAAAGERLGQSAGRVALLVMADGSARRGRRAPGHLDERSAEFDAGVERAIRAGEPGALATIDPVLARELMAAGRPAWQVLAGALAPGRPGALPAAGTGNGTELKAEVLYAGDPFGVAYLVASLLVTGLPGPAAPSAG